jgi:hypothetical protein
VERAWVLPPVSRIGAITPDERAAVINNSVIRGHYEEAVDRESAYEKLKTRSDSRTGAVDGGAVPRGKAAGGPAAGAPNAGSQLSDLIFGSTGPRGGRHEGILESAARSAARSVGSGMARSIMRGMLGSILGGSRR